MQPNQWSQQQQFGYGGGFQSGGMGGQQQPSFMQTQPTGFGQAQQQRPMQTGMPGMQSQPTGMPMGGMGGMGMGGMSGMSSAPTGMGGLRATNSGSGNNQYAFLNAPPPPGSFGGGPQRQGSFQGGLSSQPTGFPGGGGGLMSQPTGMGMMSQPTGMGMGGGGLMSQPTGMGGLRTQPTGVHDPRLQAMMQTFMPSNMSQVSYSS